MQPISCVHAVLMGGGHFVDRPRPSNLHPEWNSMMKCLKRRMDRMSMDRESYVCKRCYSPGIMKGGFTPCRHVQGENMYRTVLILTQYTVMMVNEREKRNTKKEKQRVKVPMIRHPLYNCLRRHALETVDLDYDCLSRGPLLALSIRRGLGYHRVLSSLIRHAWYYTCMQWTYVLSPDT